MSHSQSVRTLSAFAPLNPFKPFAYLPAMEAERLRRQVEYLVGQGWHAAIEHSDPASAFGRYWSLWKLPLFGARDVERILTEARACHEAYPNHHVRLVGYDSRRQTLGAAMVIYRGAGVS